MTVLLLKKKQDDTGSATEPIFPDFAKYPTVRVKSKDTADTLFMRALRAGAVKCFDHQNPKTLQMEHVEAILFYGFSGEPAYLSFNSVCAYIQSHARLAFQQKWENLKKVA